MDSKILVAEDDPKVRTLITWRLEADGYAVAAVPDGDAALATLEREQIELLILDLGLPGTAGLDVLTRVRADRELPVIIVSARSGERDRIVGLDLGADDYLVKPFSPDELAARVRTVLRRARTGTGTVEKSLIQAGELQIDTGARRVAMRGEDVDLTPKEFDLLAFLAASPGRAFTREELLRSVWQSSSRWQEPATVTQHIHRLRHKLELDPANPVWLRTVSRAGYSFDPGEVAA